MWIAKWGGASWFAGKFASGFLVHWLAPRWSESGIKLFAWLALPGNTIWFVLGLFVPQARLF